ncbi:hypothetical protein AMATHDRAFT_144738 [Amanita thiersii Skay4041]|uniref:Thiaminase-2/PQQC domain-containing protein n=1 Tax=Amanita thiersii Skay4041 TaxID=703135 RepID=A0A2A9NI02_9AGAR|nr:hypothetical protein AMATHDRAFT_144738 [Amanita thiersii Skay4041]
MTTNITDHLVSLKTRVSYAAATAHPFLVSAGNGTLDPALLALWLSQDRIYAAHAYPHFIGSLIANIGFDSNHGITSHQELFNQRILKLLVFSLDNVIREVNFFKDAAEKWGLPLESWMERQSTRNYTAEMARVAGGRNIEDGLVFLWAMEKVYLDAWTGVHRGLASIPGGNPSDSAVASFANNWSSPEFVEFVDELATLVNDLGIKPGTEAWIRAEGIWSRIVELEADFWPNTGEEVTQRIN